MATVTKLGCFTQEALDGLLQTTPTSAQTLDETVTVATDKKVQFRDTGLFINSGTDGKLTISSDGVGADDITLAGTVTVSDTLTMAATKAIALSAAGFTLAAVARTATADGLTTGTIASGPMLQTVTVTVSDANHIIVLPAPTPGSIVILFNGTTGYELRTSAPGTVGINGGVGASAESAIPASTTAVLICETATAWKGFQMSSTAGTLAAVEVAA